MVLHKKLEFLQGFAERETEIMSATRILRHRLVVIKSLDFREALLRKKQKECVLLLSLVVGLLNVFREFGMISE